VKPSSIAGHLRTLVAELGGDLVWVAAADLMTLLASGRQGHRTRIPPRVKSWLVLGGLRKSACYLTEDGVLASSARGNLDRVVFSVLPTSTPRVRGRPWSEVRAYLAWERAALRLERPLNAGLRARGLPLAPILVRELLLSSARALARAEALAPRSRLVLVATQHNVPARSLVITARRQGLPAVYLAHAPTSISPLYEDLPADYAGLRGEMDREAYLRLGADAEGLRVVGNPTIEIPETPVEPGGVPPIFAVSPWADQRLPMMVRMISQVCPDVTVAPHPRSDRRYLESVVPSGWTVATQPTFDLLRQGPPLLLQHSSGVALEAIALGIPTLQIQLDDEPANYLFSTDELVTSVRDAEGLRQAIRIAQAETPEARRERAARARPWVSSSGAASVKACQSLLAEAVRRGPRGPVLDGWGRPG